MTAEISAEVRTVTQRLHNGMSQGQGRALLGIPIKQLKGTQLLELTH